MDLKDALTIILPELTAISTIIGFLIPLIKGKNETRIRINEIEMLVLQIMLHSPNLPESEQLKAGDKYIKLGGNGVSKLYYEQLKNKCEKKKKKKMEGKK
jgi:hypothetical protein